MRSPRHAYAFDTLLGERLGLAYRLTQDADEWRSFGGAKCAYGRPLPGAPFFAAAGLLEARGLAPCQPTGVAGGLFPVSNSALPYDPFAATFYCLSRYEEYLPFAPDAHGRFPATASRLDALGWLRQPLVEQWAQAVGKCLQAHFPNLPLRPPAYAWQPTFDIDNAYAFRHKGFWRTTARLATDLRPGRWAHLRARWRVLRGQQPDPFDTYDRLQAWHAAAGPRPIFFFLVGNYGRFDKNLPAHRAPLQKLICQTAAHADIGLHPSYPSSEQPTRFATERARLTVICPRPVFRSRQHYLRFRLPDTYRHLRAAGLTEEHSMGFADAIGFRAGTSRPFWWYDLLQEAVTDLRVVPFACMDVTLRRQFATAPAALAAVGELIDHVRAAHGQFTTLFHNESVGGAAAGWLGWESFYPELMRRALALTK